MGLEYIKYTHILSMSILSTHSECVIFLIASYDCTEIEKKCYILRELHMKSKYFILDFKNNLQEH